MHCPHLKPELSGCIDSISPFQVVRKLSGAGPTCTQSLQRVLMEQFRGEVLGIWRQSIIPLRPHNLI